MTGLNISDLVLGDVILVSHKGFDWSSLPIKIANFSKQGYLNRGWTHAALYIGDGKVVEAFPTGIVIREIKDVYLNDSTGLLVLRHRNASADALKNAVDFCKNENGAKYDFRGLIFFVFFDIVPQQLHFLLDNDYMGHLFNVSNSYFCSELVGTGFQKANVYCFEEDPYKVMPIDFNNDLLFQKIARIDIPRKESNFVYAFKAAVLSCIYFVAVFLLPLFIILAALLTILGVALLFALLINKLRPSNQPKKATKA